MPDRNHRLARSIGCLTMAMAVDWSSLQSELLNLVADGLLATGDIDYYASLRAVCHSWRDATADPRGPDPRFRPRSLVMIDSHAEDAQDSRRLFLNMDTGRFVWKELPVLRDYACLATDNDGLLLLQRPSASNEISALNPFTGASISFPRQYPADASGGRMVATGSSPMVVLCSFHDKQHGAMVDLNSQSAPELIFVAKPALDSFASVVSCQGRVYAMDRKGTVAELGRHWKITTIVDGGWRQEASRPSFLVDNSGELLIVRPPVPGKVLQVYAVDLENRVLRMIKSIGNRAIFVGDRSLSACADGLPTIEANCVYYIGGVFELEKQCGIYMHCLEDGGREKLIEPIAI
jgi:hypothetical protein